MTTLIVKTLAFLEVMVIIIAVGQTYACYKIEKHEVSNEVIAILGMVSVLGLIWSIVSLITFYKVLA